MAAVLLAGCSGQSPDSRRQDVVMMRKNADLEAAMFQTRHGLPKFMDRLSHARPGESFALKARFRENGTFEHMWVDHLTVDGDKIDGTLADEPLIAKSHHRGERVAVSREDIEDWLIRDVDGKVEGGFTEAVLGKKAGK